MMKKGYDNLPFNIVNQIRQKLRYLARLHKEIAGLRGEAKDLQDLLRPDRYDSFVQAVIRIRQTSPKVAFTLGNYIKEQN